MKQKTEQEQRNIGRQTAYIISSDELNNSQYVKTEGEWDPNYIKVRGLKASRVNIIGVVVSVSDNEGKINSITIDDGTSTASIRVFDDSVNVECEIGDVLLIIGKPRAYNDQNYIVPEIIKKIKNEKWVEVRKRELERLKIEAPKEESNSSEGKQEEEKDTEEKQENSSSEKKSNVEESNVEEESVSSDNSSEDIFNIIKDLDNGEGADTEEVIEKSGRPDCEKIIDSLLNEGEIFELKPGKLKVLE